MHIIQRYRAFQQEGLKILAAQSRVVTTSSGITEYAYQGDGSALLISHGSFGGFDQGLLSVNCLNDIQARFIAPSRFGYLETSHADRMHPHRRKRVRMLICLIPSRLKKCTYWDYPQAECRHCNLRSNFLIVVGDHPGICCQSPANTSATGSRIHGRAYSDWRVVWLGTAATVFPSLPA